MAYFTSQRYASAVYADVMCPSVRPSVCCLSQADIVSKQLERSSWFLARMLPYFHTVLKETRVSSI